MLAPLNAAQQASLLFLLFLLLHGPLLSEGFGVEFDAWSNALNAKIIAETGVYEVSRLPGHPLHELLLSSLWPWQSYFFFNLLSALVSSGALVVLFFWARRQGLAQPWLLSFSFGLIPVFFLAGAYTIDYNFALFFSLLSFYFWTAPRPAWLWAGLFLGLATGFRISSIAMLLPFSFLLGWRPKDAGRHLGFWATAAVVALLCYLPALQRYGLAFLDFHKPPFPSLANVLYKLSFGIWGLPLSLYLLYWLWARLRRYARPPAPLPARWSVMLLIILLLQALVFARLPFKSHFFIPLLPFLWLALFATSRPAQRWGLSLAAALSLFTFGFDYHQPHRGATPSAAALSFKAGGKAIFLDPLQGPFGLDRSKRANKSATVERTREILAQSPQAYWLICGWYWPELVLKMPPEHPHQLDHYSSAAELRGAQAAGLPIYYLPEIRAQNQIVHGHYLADSLGQALLDR